MLSFFTPLLIIVHVNSQFSFCFIYEVSKVFALVLREDITIAFKQKFSQLAKDVLKGVARKKLE